MTDTIYPYPGGKSRYAEKIVNSLPDHSCYAEPFGGSGAVLMNKRRSEVEVFNDVDSDIVQFFRVLRDEREALQEYLINVEFSKELYDEWTRRWYNGWRPADDVKRAAMFLFNRYAQWGSKYGGISGFGRSAAGRSKADSFKAKVDTLEKFQARLREADDGEWPEDFKELRERHRGVLIDNLDYKEVFDKYDRPNDDGEGTVFYCDPPYVSTEQRYVASEAGFDHQEFIEALTELEGDWVVSYGAELPEELEDYRSEATDATRGIDRVNSDGKASKERLIWSYPARRERDFAIGGNTEDAMEEDW